MVDWAAKRPNVWPVGPAGPGPAARTGELKLSDRIAAKMEDYLPAAEPGYYNALAQLGTDWLPGLSTMASGDESRQAFGRGDYGEAAVKGAEAGLDLVPGAGKLAGALLGAGAKSGFFNKALGEKAVDMLGEGKTLESIWKETKNAFRLIGDPRRVIGGKQAQKALHLGMSCRCRNCKSR